MNSLPLRLHNKEEANRKILDNFDFNLRVAIPGIIESFDPVKQTVKVNVALTERIKCDAPSFIAEYGKGKTNVAPVPIPTLLDVPIIIPRA